MSDGPNVNVDLGALAKPADTFIKKISKGMGGMFAEGLATREAKAEVERAKGEVLAEIVRAKGEIAVKEIHQRAAYRFVEEQALHQLNMESIAAQAVPLLTNDAEPEKVDDDWVTNFWDKSRIVSDEEMQALWAKVLAGEANKPGSFSKRTIHLLAEMDRNDAALFANLCRFAWKIQELIPLVLNGRSEVYIQNGMGAKELMHLESIGLIRLADHAGGTRHGLSKFMEIEYGEKSLTLQLSPESNYGMEIGRAQFTKSGLELAVFCETGGVPNFFEYVKEKWKRYLAPRE